MASSIEVDGVRVDIGSHRLHPSTAPDLLAEVQDLLGEDLQVRVSAPATGDDLRGDRERRDHPRSGRR